MRQAGAAARGRERSSPHGDTGRTIRTTVIASPRLARRGELTSRSVRRAAPSRPAARSQHLQVALGIGDALAVLFGFYFVISLVADIGPGSWAELIFQMVTVTGVGLFAIRSQGLWVSRLNAVRAIELSRITRAVVVMGLGTIVLDRAAKLYFHVEEIFLGCVAVWIVLVGWRSVYRTWLAWQRKGGNFVRRVIIVGTDRRAMGLLELFETHPEVGIRVAGLVGSRTGGPDRRTGRPVAGQLRRRRRGARRRRRRRCRAVLERRQPGAARGADPR